MRRLRLALALLCPLGAALPGLALADDPPPVQIDNSTITYNASHQLQATGGAGCSSNCTFTTPTLTTNAKITDTTTQTWSGASQSQAEIYIAKTFTGSGTVNGDYTPFAEYLNLTPNMSINQVPGAGGAGMYIKMTPGANSNSIMTNLALLLQIQNTPATAGEYYTEATQIIGSNNVGGTSSVPSGTGEALNASYKLISGATYWNAIQTFEMNGAVTAGASVNFKRGWYYMLTSADVTSGTVLDCLFQAYNQFAQTSGANSGGWKNGFVFGSSGGNFPIAATGTGWLLAPGSSDAGGTASIGTIIDAHLMTVANYELNLPGLQVAGDGSIVQGSATGGSMGAGTINVSGGFYVNGVNVTTGGGGCTNNCTFTGTTTIAATTFTGTQTFGTDQTNGLSIAGNSGYVAVTTTGSGTPTMRMAIPNSGHFTVTNGGVAVFDVLENTAGAPAVYVQVRNNTSGGNTANIYAAGATNAALGLNANGSGVISLNSQAKFTAGSSSPAWFFNTKLKFSQTTQPTITTGSATIDGNASDTAGTITETASQGAVALTFNAAFGNTPHCTISSPSGASATSYSVSTTVLTINHATASGDVWSYHCYN